MIKHKLCINKLCAHEWDGNEEFCDWCGAKGKTIELFRAWNIKVFHKVLSELEVQNEYKKGLRNEDFRQE